VAIRILHPAPGSDAGPLERLLADARAANADRLATRFRHAGSHDVRIESSPPDGRPFGARLRELLTGLAPRGGIVVLGSGAVPLASEADTAALVATAGSGERRALANSFYSADVVAIGRAGSLPDVPDLASDNALPRWLAEQAGWRVDDLRRRWRLAIDLDSPVDLLVAGWEHGLDGDEDLALAVRERAALIRAITEDPRAEVLVAGRTNASTLRWLERRTASRTRALVEERGLRASRLAGASETEAGRQPRSALGLLLDDRGAGEFGALLADLADAAVVDTRVLLAHRLGVDESGWPSGEDRFASDLLLAERVADPWLRELTASARDSTIPVLLGGHTLVGPGLRRLLRGAR
jgi:hypothetical protein